MSRAANVTLTFTGDLSTVEQQYEAFVRKVQQPLKVPLSAEGVGAGNTSSTTTFATGNVPGATPGIGGANNSQLIAAMNQLTGALARVTVPGPAAGPAGWPAGTATWASPPGGYAPYVPPPQPAPQPVPPPQPPPPPPPAQRSPFGLGRLQRYATAGYLINEAVNMAAAYQIEGIEERLAVGGGGNVDLMRQFHAQTNFANTWENSNPGAKLGGIIREYFTGDREAAARAIQDAGAGNRRVDAGRDFGDFSRSARQRAFISAGGREEFEPYRAATVNRDNELRTAQSKHDAQVAADGATGNRDSSRVDAQLRETTNSITSDYLATVAKIAREGIRKVGEETFTRNPELQKLADEIPIFAERAAGNFRRASRMSLVSDIDAGVGAERDTDIRASKRRAGNARIFAFDADQAREDLNDIAVNASTGESFTRETLGDSRGALEARQRARRQRLFGNPDLSTPGAAARLLSGQNANAAQDTAELRAYDLSQSYVSQDLDAGERVSALLAQRRPIGAEGESIYSRGTNAADRFVDRGQDQNAITELRTTRNQLEAFRNEILLGGSGVEVSAGAFGPGGTEGNQQESVVKAVQDLGEKIDSITTAINNLSQD